MTQPIKIVKILGGLGNQMFQYALYTALQRHHPDEMVMADLHGFNGYRRKYQLNEVFGIDIKQATCGMIAHVAYPYPNFQSWRFGSRLLPKRRTMCVEPHNFAIDHEAISRQGNTYYDGYWQHEEYFSDCRDILMERFHFPDFADEANTALAQRLEKEEAVSIHVRRTDYIGDKLFYDLTATDYYTQAIHYIRQHAQAQLFCIFSDDIVWCKNHLQPLLNDVEVIFADWNNGKQGIQDMHLMTLCRHHIIANSSFSWWGAWLATQTGAINIGPKLWWRRQAAVTPVPSHWITI